MRINTHTHPALPRRVPPRPALFFCAHSGGWGVDRRAARERQRDAGTFKYIYQISQLGAAEPRGFVKPAASAAWESAVGSHLRRAWEWR